MLAISSICTRPVLPSQTSAWAVSRHTRSTAPHLSRRRLMLARQSIRPRLPLSLLRVILRGRDRKLVSSRRLLKLKMRHREVLHRRSTVLRHCKYPSKHLRLLADNAVSTRHSDSSHSSSLSSATCSSSTRRRRNKIPAIIAHRCCGGVLWLSPVSAGSYLVKCSLSLQWLVLEAMRCW